MRYYYKCGNNYCSLQKPLNNYNYEQITEEQFNIATQQPLPTEKEQIRINKYARINELKALLHEMDYIGVKIATGRATREEYADKIILMTQYASEINQLEDELNLLEV